MIDFPGIDDPLDAMTEDKYDNNHKADTGKSDLLLVLLVLPTMAHSRHASILLQSKISMIKIRSLQNC